MTQDGCDFIGRKDFVFMNFHIEPMEALTFSSFQEDSLHGSQALKQYVPFQWRYTDNFMLDSERASLFIRYSQNDTSIALHSGALHRFQSGEK